jgi:hypothetical protein
MDLLVVPVLVVTAEVETVALEQVQHLPLGLLTQVLAEVVAVVKTLEAAQVLMVVLGFSY